MRRHRRRLGLFVLASGLAVVLGGPFLIPVPPLTGTFPPQTLADDDSEFIEINGLDIHVKKMGQGCPPGIKIKTSWLYGQEVPFFM